MTEQDVTRAKILGVLIQDARLHAGRSVEDCARVLNIAPEAFSRAEEGTHVISLPELEALAMYLEVPMAHFWGSQTLENSRPASYEEMLALRNKIVGALLRQARLEAGRSAEELAEEIGTDVERIHAYEMGAEKVPFLELEKLGQYLGVTIDYFLDDKRGPLGRHEAAQEMQKRFNELPRDVQEFVVKPINISYLETAMRLSEMDVDKLRNIAAGILDITY
jgi:transcriptional regulator with XRE-family HTH domain